jgi:hypothetical protein
MLCYASGMEIVNIEPIEPLLCHHCSLRPAVYYLEPDCGHDPCCASCFDLFFGICGKCHKPTLLRELVSVTVARQTRMDPAEYEDWCENCAAEPDPQGSRDDEGD